MPAGVRPFDVAAGHESHRGPRFWLDLIVVNGNFWIDSCSGYLSYRELVLILLVSKHRRMQWYKNLRAVSNSCGQCFSLLILGGSL